MRPFVLAFVLAAGLLSGFQLSADDDPKKDGDRYTIPAEADVEGLLKFIQGIREFEPQTPEESQLHRRQASVAIKDAARKILKLEKDTSSEAYLLAKTIELGSEIRSLIAADRAEREEYVGKVLEVLSSPKVGVQQYDLALKTTQLLESLDAQAAVAAYKAFEPLFAKSLNKKVAEIAEMMPGAIRRLELPGHAIDLKAPKFNGSPFNLADLKGKVVLLDFWATWCGPCIAEIPNMRKLYAKYHEQGFEIVGLSVDEDREDLENFMDKRRLPWIILHDQENDGQHAVLKEYGIMGYPTMFLIGKDGNVVDIHARGDTLEDLLEQQFAEEKPADK